VTATGAFSIGAAVAVLFSGTFVSGVAVVLDCCDVCNVLSADEGVCVWAERGGTIRVRAINAINIALDNFFIISFLSYFMLFISGTITLSKSVS
jgi:hypothetical protein